MRKAECLDDVPNLRNEGRRNVSRTKQRYYQVINGKIKINLKQVKNFGSVSKKTTNVLQDFTFTAFEKGSI